ncbi:MAG: hypothetical protein FJX72_17550 [Armatimonadetes bacterium]|nr:hypothetical protein [Armatimonadota bacterium]
MPHILDLRPRVVFGAADHGRHNLANGVAAGAHRNGAADAPYRPELGGPLAEDIPAPPRGQIPPSADEHATTFGTGPVAGRLGLGNGGIVVAAEDQVVYPCAVDGPALVNRTAYGKPCVFAAGVVRQWLPGESGRAGDASLDDLGLIGRDLHGLVALGVVRKRGRHA